MSDFEDMASYLIDTSGYFSRHWSRDVNGNLTIDGYRKILSDAKYRLTEVEHRAIALKAFIPQIEAKLKKRQDEGDNSE